MALTERTQGTYLQIKYQGICEIAKKPRDGFKEIEVQNPKDGSTVKKYVREYRSVDGYIDKLEWKDTKDKFSTRYQSWVLHISDGDFSATLEFPFRSKVGTRLMNVAENIDFRQPIEIGAWLTEEGMAVSFKQNGENVPAKYTKDERHGCPQPINDPINGWDWSGVNNFLWKQLTEFVVPRCEEAFKARHPQGTPQGRPAGQSVKSYVEENLGGMDDANAALQQGDHDIPF